jgi:hypothetical protein
MKLLPAILLAAAISAHAQSDDIRTEATLMPCPNGPGVAVVAIDANGNETWAGCWGSDPVPERGYEERRHERHDRDDQIRR